MTQRCSPGLVLWSRCDAHLAENCHIPREPYSCVNELGTFMKRISLYIGFVESGWDHRWPTHPRQIYSVYNQVSDHVVWRQCAIIRQRVPHRGGLFPVYSGKPIRTLGYTLSSPIIAFFFWIITDQIKKMRDEIKEEEREAGGASWEALDLVKMSLTSKVMRLLQLGGPPSLLKAFRRLLALEFLIT